MKFNKHLILILIILSAIIFSAGCLSFFHNENDYITTAEGYHYYFEDMNGKSFYETIYEGDVTPYVTGKQPMEWIQYVQKLQFIEDGYDEHGEEKEIFYNVEETIARGGGDCEDKSILLARGLKELGIDCAIIIQAKHVTVGINKTQVEKGYKGLGLPFRTPKNLYFKVGTDDYYVIESTANWKIGEFDEYPLIYEKMIIV